MGSKIQVQQIISIIQSDMITWFVSPEYTTQNDMATLPVEKACVKPPGSTENKVFL